MDSARGDRSGGNARGNARGAGGSRGGSTGGRSGAGGRSSAAGRSSGDGRSSSGSGRSGESGRTSSSGRGAGAGRSSDSPRSSSSTGRGAASGRSGGKPSFDGKPRSGGKAGAGAKSGSGRPAGGRGAGPRRRPEGNGPARRRRDDELTPRSDTQRAYDGPDIPEHITGRELDRTVAAQLRSLPERLGLRVARHLVAAGEQLESNPKIAYQHTLAARARAGRLAVVREAVGEAAYAAGEYTEALAELRAARRMNGSVAYLAVMADCQRALGHPDRALALLRTAPRDRFNADELAELTIVEAGARRDRGEIEAALRTLEHAPLDSRSRASWVARLRYMYADTLAEAGRTDEALQWFHRTEAVDGEMATDAGDRAAKLERQLGQS